MINQVNQGDRCQSGKFQSDRKKLAAGVKMTGAKRTGIKVTGVIVTGVKVKGVKVTGVQVWPETHKRQKSISQLLC